MCQNCLNCMALGMLLSHSMWIRCGSVCLLWCLCYFIATERPVMKIGPAHEEHMVR